jgi:tripartite-type tricarboxylate transporter receptor subunit TctC
VVVVLVVAVAVVIVVLGDVGAAIVSVVITAGGVLTVQPWLYKSLGYDPFKDFTPIARVTSFDFGLMTNVNNPNTKDLKSLIAYMKANPKEANYGSPGPGTVPHFAGQMIAQAAGIEMQHVAYKGSAPAMTDLLGGQIPLLLDNPPVEQYKAGKLRIIAVTGETRQRQLPDVPTLKELGMNVVADQFFALYGPAGMAPELVKRLSDAVAESLKAPEVQERLYAIGMAPAYLGPAEIAAAQLSQYRRWEQPIKSSGYVPD